MVYFFITDVLNSEFLDLTGQEPAIVTKPLDFEFFDTLNMSSSTKGDRKTAIDVASWMFNIVTSVGIILVNKALMATYGFSFGRVSRPFSNLR
ncbi:unnamed protein product [Sphenostylis stenocarpa]|uniref:Uncharacterized protein n=1 Tax=Sphenostylis stenocarpa TaxID=92480 RepID=A0AA86SDT2_9FABA|nr:unnamed protein product [Sphenostylis stenocarpa]